MQKDYEFIVLEERRKPNVYAISSLCEDGKHVIFWDFDVQKNPKTFYKIENSLKAIQRQFLLSKIYLLDSRCGYNAICLDKLDKNTVGNIKNLTPYDDRRHLEQGLTYNWKMRIGPDKKLITNIDVAGFSNFVRSNAHRIALERIYNIKIDYTRYFDESRNICLYSYWDWKVHNENGNKQMQLKAEECTEESFSYTNR